MGGFWGLGIVNRIREINWLSEVGGSGFLYRERTFVAWRREKKERASEISFGESRKRRNGG